MIKKLIGLSMACCLFNMSVGLAAQTPAAKSPTANKEPIVPLNRIVAVVNDEVISQSDLDEIIDQLTQQLQAAKMAVPPPDALRKDALEQLINFRMQMQMANRNDLKPSSDEVDKAIEQIAQSNHLTVDQLKEQLKLQHSTYEEFRKKLIDQLTITKLQQQLVGGQVRVTDSEIKEFRDLPHGPQEYKIADFYLPLAEQPTPADVNNALSKARDIQQQLNRGVNINQISPPFQDLGWRFPKDLPQIFVDQLPKLNASNASEPIRAPNGYHVLKLVDTRSSNANLTDDQIRQILLRQKYEAAVKAAIAKARKEAYVQIFPQ